MRAKKVRLIEKVRERVGISKVLKTMEVYHANAYPDAMPLNLNLK